MDHPDIGNSLNSWIQNKTQISSERIFDIGYFLDKTKNMEKVEWLPWILILPCMVCFQHKFPLTVTTWNASNNASMVTRKQWALLRVIYQTLSMWNTALLPNLTFILNTCFYQINKDPNPWLFIWERVKAIIHCVIYHHTFYSPLKHVKHKKNHCYAFCRIT